MSSLHPALYDIRKALLLVLLAGYALASNAKPDSSDPRPNIVVITADDLGLQLGCFGDPNVTTPNLDRIATEGVRFTRAYVAQSSCSPSRSAILTGLYPHQNGQIGLSHLGYTMHSEQIPNLSTIARSSGYKTALFGKFHVAPSKAFCWDHMGAPHLEDARDVDAMAAQIERFLTSVSGNPFLLYVNYADPHAPRKLDVNGRPRLKVTPDAVTIPSYYRSKDINSNKARTALAEISTCINRLDEGIGLLVDVLERHGVSDNTLILFLGDNGPAFGGAKRSSYEIGVRTPLIARWPARLQKGLVCDQLVSSIDILPTIVALLAPDAPLATSLPGISLLKSIENGATRTEIATEFNSHVPGEFFPTRTLRTDRYKIIVSLLASPDIADLQMQNGKTISQNLPHVRSLPFIQLYDLIKDPEERINLADQTGYTAETNEMLERLRLWQKVTNDPLQETTQLLKTTEEEFNRGKRYRESERAKLSY